MSGPDQYGKLNFSEANEVKYAYDARGMRIAKDFGTGSAQADQNYFFSEKWQVLEVRANGNVNPLETFAWQMGYIDAPLVRWHDANVDGDVSDAGDSTLYLLYDANYNVTAAVKILVIGQDYVPTVVERYHHTPYGLRTVLNADWSIDTDDPDNDGNYSDYNQTLAHQGGSIDFETGVIKFRHRDLHVSLGLWLERDPLGYVDGGSLVAAYASTPVNITDPAGLNPCTAALEDIVVDEAIGLLATSRLDYWTRVAVYHYYFGGGAPLNFATDPRFLNDYKAAPEVAKLKRRMEQTIDGRALRLCSELKCGESVTETVNVQNADGSLINVDVTWTVFFLGDGAVTASAVVDFKRTAQGVSWNGIYTHNRPDWFKDPVNLGIEIGGTPFQTPVRYSEPLSGEVKCCEPCCGQ
jgi:RHS repeat-associated protein